MTEPLAASIVRELVRTPALRATLAALAPELDPGAARALVRAALWEDMELGMRALAAGPRLALALAAGAGELWRSLANVPYPVLAALARELPARLRAWLRRRSEMAAIWPWRPG